MTTYTDFLAAKTHLEGEHGFTPDDLPSDLFNFQRDLVEWACRKGRAALFTDCGTGKTPMQLMWADQVVRHTDRRVLILTPLAVAAQTAAEADKFGIEAHVSRDGTPKRRITITNYDRLHLFNPQDFVGLVCDESSAIKSFDGERRKQVTDFARKLPYRLLATATAAPNDYVELGTSSEALGYLGRMDMLGRWFTNRMQSSKGVRMWGDDKWRFKGHAEEPFWQWVASWARAMRKPSDLGYDDDGFELPNLNVRQTVISARQAAEGHLFDVPAFGLREERAELRRTLTERCETAAGMVEGPEPAVVWCHMNAESDRLETLIDGAVQVRGSDPAEAKEETLQAFTRGDIRVLVTKPSIAGWGLNWQHCNRSVYFPSHSYEQWYQAVRRMWRFGQQHPVTVDVVASEGTAGILENLERKADQADRMFASLTAHMADAMHIDRDDYDYSTPVEVPEWAA